MKDGAENNIENILKELLSVYKLVNSQQIEEAKKSVLKGRTRIAVYKMCDGSRGVTQIAKELHVAQPTVTHHLTELSELGLVHSTTVSGKKFYERSI